MLEYFIDNSTKFSMANIQFYPDDLTNMLKFSREIDRLNRYDTKSNDFFELELKLCIRNIGRV